MSRNLRRTVYSVTALAGLFACGVGLSGVAAAAPTPPSPASSAPSSAGPAPVPSLLQPLDASHGLLGMQRGSIHSASTPDMSQIPVARQLPMIDITPLPTQGPAPDDASAEDASADEPPADDTAADDTAAAQ